MLCKSPPILQALHICKIESNIDRNSFYIHLIKQHASGEMLGPRDLISRVKLTCEKYGISLLNYIFDDSYSRVVRNNFTKGCAVQDGLTDSVCLLLGNINPQNGILLNLMIRSF